jgi:DNA polymerase-1
MINPNNRTMLVDGDILLYVCSTQMEEPIKWDEDTWTLHASESKTIDKFADTITYYSQILLCNNIAIALSSKTNFRKKISPLYKYGRRNNRKPLTFSPLREWVKKNFKTYEMPYLEGDDVLGILATSDMIKGDKVILTKDKDMKTVPSTIWFMQGDDYTIVDEDTANYNHMIQTLTGDSTDSYSGCPSVGKITAEKILKEHKGNKGAMWDAVVKRYKMNKLDRKYALLQARLSRIIRASDYNFKTRRPRLWLPQV